LTAWIRSVAGLTAASCRWLVKRRRSPRIGYYASNRRVYRPRSLRKCAFLLRTTVCNRLPTATLFETGNFLNHFNLKMFHSNCVGSASKYRFKKSFFFSLYFISKIKSILFSVSYCSFFEYSETFFFLIT
jgi:hypothetical protein